jgi:hypothetical protein
MGFLSAHELTHAVIALGPNRVFVAYPQSLASWFAPFVERQRGDVGAADAWVKLEANHTSKQFRVTASTGQDVAGLSLGDAVAALWEQVTFLLVDKLVGALALHAAAVRRDNDVVLIPGSSGAGKTQLALWYRSRGFALATDELVLLTSDDHRSNALSVTMLARPLFLKRTSSSPNLMPGEGWEPRQDYFNGEVMLPADTSPRPSQDIGTGLVVFPHYAEGSPLCLTALTQARAGQLLLGQCVNVRNLQSGGLALAAATVRRLPAIALRYGATEQLSGTLDVLTRQVLAAAPNAGDLAALCDGFNARAASWHSAASIAATVQASAPAPLSPTAPAPARRLTVGMATYDEYDGVYFTIQSIRTHHPELKNAIEFIVIDNNPTGPCAEALKQLGNWIDGYRYIPLRDWQGTAVRDAVFEHASCEIVMCVDPHVLIVPGALSRLLDYCQATPGSRDLLQGPVLYDDLRSISTHFEPRWQAGMYGVWEFDPRGADPNSPAFDIPMQGLGLFVCRRTAWPGFNRAFRGFGGEEGYIHEKIRQRGGRTLCLPFLRWLHRFARPLGLPYPNRWDDRLRNYFIGHTELGLNTVALEAHFAELLGSENAARILEQVRKESLTNSLEEKDRVVRAKAGVQALPSTAEIHSPHNHSFGDQWATINYYLNMSVMKRKRIRLATQLNGVNLYRLHREILDVLDSNGEIELTMSEPTVGVSGYDVWSAPYFPTKQRWDASAKHRYVCVQLDGQSAAHATNPSPEEERLTLRYLEERCPGFETVRLGKHLSVQQCVDIAANSAFFIGVDSGMSHLCHSVGVPIFLLEYGLPTVTTHSGKAHTLCKGYDDLAGRLDRYIGYLHAAGLPDAQGASKRDHTVDPSVENVAPPDELKKSNQPKANADQESSAVAKDKSQLNVHIRRILSLMTPRAVIGHSKVRIGAEADGGYVMVDDLGDVQLCYSFGVGFDVSWDLEMARRGATVFQYDHTVLGPCIHNASFRFHRLGVAPIDVDNMRTIQTLLEENGHSSETEMVMKMDVEGAEWDAIDAAPVDTLGLFKQIVCEFHGLTVLGDTRWFERAERVLGKLASTHMPVHVHGNNYGAFRIVEGIPVPDVLEVSFVRRSSYATEPGSESFPTILDRPNNPGAPDIYLGRFAF